MKLYIFLLLAFIGFFKKKDFISVHRVDTRATLAYIGDTQNNSLLIYERNGHRGTVAAVMHV